MTPKTTSFESLGLALPVQKALADVGYETPTPIQAASIPTLLQGRDILGQAQTGTGKTAAFALPLLSRLDLSARVPQVLVLTPTRELAIQVAEAFQTYARYLPGFHILPVYGGQSARTQLRRLKQGVQVIVGTPGRLMDHLRRKSLVLDSLRMLVLDEADEMLKRGFLEDVEWILRHTPKTRQTALFSATMPDVIVDVARRHLRDAQQIKIRNKPGTVSTIRQKYWQVSGVHKLDALSRILEMEEIDAAIVFVRTRVQTVSLQEKLEARGYAAAALNGDMTQAVREQTVQRLKSGKLDILVATDVAARGLDVGRVSHVINYDIPYDTEAYVHRIGRTGRAGREGTAILFVAPREMRMLRAIERATRQSIDKMKLPSNRLLSDRRTARFRQRLLDVVARQELDFADTLLTRIVQETGLTIQQVAAAAVYLAQRDRPLRPGSESTAAATEKVLCETASPVVESGRPPRAGRSAPAAKRRRATGCDSRVRQTEAPRLKQFPEIAMQRFRLEVGRNQQATPRDIVGAIANEADIDSRYIGHIQLYADHSTVDLPAGMPRETFRHLRNVFVRGCRLKISLLEKPGVQNGRRSVSAEAKQGKAGMHGKKSSRGRRVGSSQA